MYTYMYAFMLVYNYTPGIYCTVISEVFS